MSVLVCLCKHNGHVLLTINQQEKGNPQNNKDIDLTICAANSMKD